MTKDDRFHPHLAMTLPNNVSALKLLLINVYLKYNKKIKMLKLYTSKGRVIKKDVSFYSDN